jgi:hypothetical protein
MKATATFLSDRFILISRRLEGAERRPSAAARDQHSTAKEKDYLSRTISRRQLQGFAEWRTI